MDKNLWERLERFNIIPKLEAAGMLGNGRYIDIDKKKVRYGLPAIDPSRPWIYVNPDPDMLCMEYQAFERGFGLIPKRCLSCWKIVVSPRTFEELMLLYDLERDLAKENAKCWCKCGVEVRNFVPRNYGGYFYTSSQVEGLKRFKGVRKAVSETISPDVPVILKRGCTEFELKHGPSNKWEYSQHAMKLENDFWDAIDAQSGAIKQPEFVIKNIIQYWMLFAWGRGDPTVIKFNDGKPLFEPCLIYNRKEGG